MLLINKFQIQLTTKILTNNYISLQFINNKLFILHNPSNINITKLLTKNNITYKIIYIILQTKYIINWII